MAQHTISRRLSRSFNVYLRCRGIRYDPSPFTARHFHGRDDDTGTDDSIKKIKQDIDKLKGSSNATTLRIHRCGNAFEKQSQGKVVQPVAKSDRSVDSHDGPTKADNFQFKVEPDQLLESKVSANCEKENPSEKCVKKPKAFEKFDISKFEKVCEESSQYIKNLLNGTSTMPETIDSNVSVKESDSLSHNQGLRMPSHQDVHGLKTPLKNQEKDQKINIQIHYKTRSPENNVDSSLSLNQAQTENEASTTLVEDKSKNSHKQTFSEKISRITSEFNNSFADNVTEKSSKVPQNESKTFLKMNSNSSIMDSRHTKFNSNRKEISSSSENKPTIVSLDSTVEPYIFPTDIENLGQDHIDTKTSRQRSSEGHMHEFDVSSSKSDVSDEITEILKTHSAENKKRRSKDVKIDSRLPSFRLPKVSEKAEFSAFPSKAVHHGIGNCPSKSPLRGTVGLLLGKTSMEKETNTYGKDHKWYKSQASGGINMTPVTLSSDKQDHFATKMDKKNPMIGTTKVDHIVSSYHDDKSVPDSKSVIKSNQLKTKKPKSSDNECQIAILENKFERTIESQIIAEFCRNKSDRNESASNSPSKINPVNPIFEVKKNYENQRTPEQSNLIYKEKYNPVDTIFEVKSISPNNNIMYSKTAGTTTHTPDKETAISVTGNIIKSESDLTPGELYNSSPECGTNEHILENNTPKLKRPQMKIKRTNKIASKLGKRHKSKGEEHASKQKNVQLETDFQPGNIDKSKSEISQLDVGNLAKTSQEKIVPPWRRIGNKSNLKPRKISKSKADVSGLIHGKIHKSKGEENASKQKNVQLETDFQPGNIDKSKSKVDQLDVGNLDETAKENIVQPWRRISNKSDFKPRKISKSNADVSGLLHDGIASETSKQDKIERKKKMADANVEETGKLNSEISKLKEQNESETLSQKNSRNDMEITAETHLTPGELYNSKSEGDLYEERQFTRPKRKIRNETEEREFTRPKRKMRNEMEFNPENYGDRFKPKEKISSRVLKQKKAQNKAKSKAKTHLTPSDRLDEKSEVKKRRTKQFKEQDIEHDSSIGNKTESKSEELSKNYELKSEENLSKLRRNSEVPHMSRDDQQEENLKHAKLYISKAKRLHDIAKRKSVERKKRLRSGKKQKSKKKSRETEDSLKPTEKKMTLSEFLYGLVVKKDGNNKGGGNHRNFTTYSALRCPISISQNWPLRYRKVHRFNTKFNSSNPKNNDVFISPEVVKQGLGAEAIHKERQLNGHEKKSSELKANDEGLSKSFEASRKHIKPLNDEIKSTDGKNHIKIQGGSPLEQKHKRLLNKIKGKDEDIKIQIKGGSQEGNERRRADSINQNNKRGYNTLSQHIWQSIRYFFPVSSKTSGKQN